MQLRRLSVEIYSNRPEIKVELIVQVRDNVSRPFRKGFIRYQVVFPQDFLTAGFGVNLIMQMLEKVSRPPREGLIGYQVTFAQNFP